MPPEEIVEQQKIRQCLFLAIQALPAKQRVVVWLRSAEQLSFAEIGCQLQIPLSTAKATFHRAKSSLRQQLAGWLEQMGRKGSCSGERGAEETKLVVFV